MEFRDLKYLCEIVKAGHLGRAAERLGLTQPALTKSIARLEGELAVSLLERTRKGVTVTPCGEHLVGTGEVGGRHLVAWDAVVARQVRARQRRAAVAAVGKPEPISIWMASITCAPCPTVSPPE